MRRLFLLLAVAVLAVLPALPAGAGGGCHIPGLSDAAGTRVELTGGCFTPTVARIEPGDTVMFANIDEQTHRVDAPGGWGLADDLLPGEVAAFRFDNAGVFPYACYFHPGMSGAVVVGDGALASTDALGVEQVSVDDAKGQAAVPPPPGSSGSSGGADDSGSASAATGQDPSSTTGDAAVAASTAPASGAPLNLMLATAAAGLAILLLAAVMLRRRRAPVSGA